MPGIAAARSNTTRSTETLRGQILSVYYSSPGFTAGVIRIESLDRVKFSGPFMVEQGDQIELEGNWESHPKYGRQFAAKRFQYALPICQKGLATHLANHPRIKGIGHIRAQAIAEKLGDDFERIVVESPARLAEIPGITMDTALQIQAEWARTSELNHALTWLSAFGLTHHQITLLVEKYGNTAVAVLKQDPYLLVREIRGFGFKRVDQIALQMGVEKDDPSRLRAGVIQCVREALDEGHTWTEDEALVEAATELLVMDTLDAEMLVGEALDELVRVDELMSVDYQGHILIAQPDMRDMEADLEVVFREGHHPNPAVREAGGRENIRELIEARCGGQNTNSPSIFDALEALVDKISPTLNPGQRKAVFNSARHRISLISGGAGSGKTFIIRTLTELFQTLGLTVKLAAPTGKAAKRMEEVVGHEASTIHRLLGYDGKGFLRGADNPLDTDVLIVDETSMVDVSLAYHLIQALEFERTALILVGDHNQLPPVGPGNLLRDLIESSMVPAVKLDQVVRQAGELKANSLAILKGHVAETVREGEERRRPWYKISNLKAEEDVGEFILNMYQTVLQESLGFDVLDDVQLLTPTHKGPLGVTALNITLQRLLQKKLWDVDVVPVLEGRRPKFYTHDKVIQRRNNYDLGVMNGTIGRILDVDHKTGDLRVLFDGKSIELSQKDGNLRDLHLAYALTVHSTQGSEFPCVICVIHKAHSFMHHRNLFYTAVTRARETAIVVGDNWGIKNCAERKHLGRRRTFLALAE